MHYFRKTRQKIRVFHKRCVTFRNSAQELKLNKPLKQNLPEPFLNFLFLVNLTEREHSRGQTWGGTEQ